MTEGDIHDSEEGLGLAAKEKPRSSFEKQWEHGRRQYEALGGKVTAIFLRPENPKTDVPVVLVPGWSEGSEVLQVSAAEIFNAGRPVITFDHPRRGGSVETQSEHSIDEIRRVMAIETIFQQGDISEADMVTHSEGAIVAAIFASNHPEIVKKMVLYNPAGLIGKDTLPGLLGRFVKKNVGNSIQALEDRNARVNIIKGQVEGARYIAQNPLRAFNEIRAISQAEIDDALREINHNGTKIAVVHGVDDPGFPMDRMQKVVKWNKSLDKAESPDGIQNLELAPNPEGFIDGFYSATGSHDTLYTHPEKYAHVADHILTALEQK